MSKCSAKGKNINDRIGALAGAGGAFDRLEIAVEAHPNFRERAIPASRAESVFRKRGIHGGETIFDLRGTFSEKNFDRNHLYRDLHGAASLDHIEEISGRGQAGTRSVRIPLVLN